MNRDTVAGSITDSQSLNRFSYVEGNPLTYVDLNGQARTWLSSYNGLHGILDILGFVPVLGNVTALVSIGLDIATGNYDAIMADAIGLLPMGHILGAVGAVGGVALAHFATPALTHLLAHSSVLKSGLIATFAKKSEKRLVTTADTRKVSNAVYKKLRRLSPSKEIRKMVNDNVNLPMDDFALPGLKITTPLEADHIVPMNITTRMPEFDKLTFEQQLDVLNYKPNFKGLSSTANRSRGTKTYAEWETYAKKNIDVEPSFKAEMMSVENNMNYELQDLITGLARKNGK